MRSRVGRLSVERFGWAHANRWLLIRRAIQLSVLGLFVAGPLAGIWILKGNLSSSLILDTIPLADPLVVLQTLTAGHLPELTLLTGGAIVTFAYALLGGRTFCSFVCPVNMVTDGAAVIRRALDIAPGKRLPDAARYWILAVVLILPALTGIIVWELVNPVSLVIRGVVFGVGAGWFIIVAIFVLDAFVSPRAWCGHLCPLGAFYSLLGKVSPVKISATGRDHCNDCMDCFAICPEPQVIKLPLKGSGSPAIRDSACTRCGRCVDVCSKQVFHFQISR